VPGQDSLQAVDLAVVYRALGQDYDVDRRNSASWTGEAMRMFIGDDWAEDHHDVKVMDETGRVLAKRRLPEGVTGMARLHELTGQQLGQDAEDAEVAVGIETDRGPWVAALIAAGYAVFPVNPLQASRYRERRGVSGAKSDGADAHVLADMVRTDSHQLRPAAGDGPQAEAIKALARMHKTLIWAHPAPAAAAAPAAGVFPCRAGSL
jgi:Transposase